MRHLNKERGTAGPTVGEREPGAGRMEVGSAQPPKRVGAASCYVVAGVEKTLNNQLAFVYGMPCAGNVLEPGLSTPLCFLPSRGDHHHNCWLTRGDQPNGTNFCVAQNNTRQDCQPGEIGQMASKVSQSPE